MCVFSIIDEVTYSLIEECRGAVLKDGQVSFLYKVVISIFILRNDVRYTWNIAIHNREIVGCCQWLLFKGQPKGKPSIDGPWLLSVSLGSFVLLPQHLLAALTQECCLDTVCSTDFNFSHSWFIQRTQKGRAVNRLPRCPLLVEGSLL